MAKLSKNKSDKPEGNTCNICNRERATSLNQ